MMLAKKSTDLIESQKRVAVLEKVLKANGLPVPGSIATPGGGTGQIGVAASGPSELLEENQQLREKLKQGAENITNLFRMVETAEAEKSKLREEIVKLKETIADKDTELNQKIEKLETFSTAFEIFQQHAASV